MCCCWISTARWRLSRRAWSLGTIYKGMFEFMAIQIVAIALIFLFPAIATWLPERLFGSGALVVSEPLSTEQAHQR